MNGKIEIEPFALGMSPYGPVILLHDKAQGPVHRVFHMLVSPECLNLLLIRGRGSVPSRPLTHNLIGTVMSQLNARVAYSVITKIEHNTFYADLVLNHNGKEVAIDCGPFDAFLLCLDANVPIFCDEKVFQDVGIAVNETGERVDGEGSAPQTAQTEGEKASDKPVSDEDLKKLGPFADVIQNLDLEDFGNPDARKKEGT